MEDNGEQGPAKGSFGNRLKELFSGAERSKQKECLGVAYEYVELAGDAVLAARLGRGKEKVTAIDIYGTTETETSFAGLEEEVTLENWKELRPVLNREQFNYWKRWVEKNGYEGLPIRFHPTKNALKYWDEQPYEVGVGDLSMTIGGRESSLSGYDWTEGSQDPVVLQPKETVMDVLTCLEKGKEWEVPVDADILHVAERDVRSGALSLVDRRVKRRGNFGDRVINTDMDDETIKSVVEKLAGTEKEYPKLVALCKQVSEAGGVKEYVLAHYGSVYLHKEDEHESTMESVIRGRVRLYYPDLTRSTASEEAQWAALKSVFEDIRLPGFDYAGAETAHAGKPEPLPVGEITRALIDKEKLKRAISVREEVHPEICGEYEVGYLSTQNAADEIIKERITPMLKVLGIDQERFWNSGSPKLSRKLATVLDTRSPIFRYFDYSHENGGKVKVVISGNPTDILQASTDKSWTSCVNLNGGINKHSLYLDVAAGNVIGYVFSEDKPAGRVLIRFTTDETGREGVAMERYYGDTRFEEVLEKTVKQVAENNNLVAEQKGFTKKKVPAMYTDLGRKWRSDTIYYGYEQEEMVRLEKSKNR
jgi:hypothetical protein